MSTYLDTTNAAVRRILFQASELETLSRAFHQTGNLLMAERLGHISDVLFREGDAITDAMNKRVDDDFKQAQQASANVLKACLAGAELGRQ